MEFIGRIQKDGDIDFGERNGAIFRKMLRDNPGMLLKITQVLPESDKQRRFLEGAVIPLATFHQEGLDYRNPDDCRKVREWLKEEFNSELVVVGGRAHRIAKSTKGREALQPFLERVVTWLIENYAPPSEALDPDAYKHWRDTVFPTGGPDTYIDYLLTCGILQKPSI